MTLTPEAARLTTYREVFAVREFTVLFGARLLGIAAETLRILALSVLVFHTTGSALLSAAAFGVGFLPQVVGGALLTSLADRLPPRPLIVAGYLLQAAAAGAVAAITMPTAALLLLFAAVACLVPVASAAASGLIPTLLTGDRYVLGRSLSNMAGAGAQIGGLSLGGGLLAVLAPRQALAASAALLLVAGAVARWGLRAHAARSGVHASPVRATWSGNRRLLGDRTVRSLLVLQWLPPSCMAAAEAVLVSYVARRGWGSGVVGVLLALLPIGMLLGDLVVGRFLAPVVRERLVLPLLIVGGAPLLLFVLEPGLTVAAGLLLLSGAGAAYGLGIQRAFLAAVPDESRGLAFGLVSTGLMTGQGLGMLVGGAVATVWSPGVAIACAGAATLVSAALALRGVSQG